MKVMKARRVRSGEEYTPLIPMATGKDITIKKNGDVQDTMRLIQKVVPQITWQTDKIAKVLKGRNLYETCANIWQFVYDHIDYTPDEDGTEQVRSPRRSWHDRFKGCDCDCYSVFIASTLTSLKIPFKYRITKYPKVWPEVPRWQHIYIIVPRNGNVDQELNNKSAYITMDCVMDEFDKEERYLQKKDYTMKLDYLDGLDGLEEEYIIPNNQDAHDLAAIYDEEELGKTAKNWLKKAVKNVVKVAAAPITQPLKVTRNLIKDPGKVIRNIPKDLKKGVQQAKQGIHIINKVTNPGAILLRNGFLVAMKVNLFNIAKKLRYGYLSDEKAIPLGIDLEKLKQVRKVREKAENIYYTAGGEKKNLAKAIINGKGNKDKKVSLAGINDDEFYADQEEYEILEDHYLMGFGQLGEPATAASIAAATSVLTAIAAALKQIKGLFKPGSSEENDFQSENGGSVEEIQKDYSSASEQEIADEVFPQEEPVQAEITNNTYVAPSAPAPSASFNTSSYAPYAPAPVFAPSPAEVPTSTNNYPAMEREENDSIITTQPNAGAEIRPSEAKQSLPVKADPPKIDDQSWMQKNSKLLIGVGGGILLLGALAWKLGSKDKKKDNSGNLKGTTKKAASSKKYTKKNIAVIKL